MMRDMKPILEIKKLKTNFKGRIKSNRLIFVQTDTEYVPRQ